jgi:hypothetical protein
VFLVSKKVVANLAQALLAVLAGNAAYFLLMPHLPPVARHNPFQMDLGLLVDFWLCLVAFGVVKIVWRQNRGPEAHKK